MTLGNTPLSFSIAGYQDVRLILFSYFFLGSDYHHSLFIIYLINEDNLTHLTPMFFYNSVNYTLYQVIYL